MSSTRSRIAPTVLALAMLISVLPLALATAEAAPLVPVPSNVGCDDLDPAACLLPFPNDHFTTADASTATGRRVNFSPAAMPRNGTEVTEGGEGKPVDPLEWNRNDGFSPGSAVMTYVPGIDLHATWGTADRPHSEVGPNEMGYFDYRDHIADIGLYQREDAPMVIINAETGERHPFWSELDSHRDAVEAEERLLIMRPAVNFEEGTRYVVGLRNLKTSSGTTIEPGDEFLAYRGGDGADASRQSHFDSSVFPVLQAAGVDRNELYLAWDFTVASERNLAERILHMRDDAFGRILGDANLADRVVQGSSPAFTVDKTEMRTDSWTDSNGQSFTRQYRRVHGRVTVPNYMDRVQQTEGHVRANQLPYDVPAPGSRLLDLDLDGLPDQNPAEPTVNVPYVCDVPLNGQRNSAILYGHGLLGDRGQIFDATKSPLRDGPFYSCAADWWGMSTPDLPTVAAILADFSNFPSLPDRAQQGFLNFMFLGRAAVHPDGFASHDAFKDNGVSLVKTADENDTPLYYDGNSQGGIMGGSLVAVSPDIKRGILGVLGMNYSTLLNRSVDWEGELKLEADLPAYSVPFYTAYQDPLERQIVFGLMQMLWDRGETNGYAHHMTDDPLANTPPHEVMLQAAYSDHQVANISAEVEARTIGAPLMVPSLAPGRHWEMEPYSVGTATYPYKGSALIYWDSGNATPPNGNIPPDQNGDPHGHPRSEPAASWQEAHFLLTGENYDVCGGGFYLTNDNPTTGKTITCHAPLWPAGSEAPVDPEPAATTLSITDASQDSGQYSDATLFQARLEDANGAGVEGREVTFLLSGGGGERTFSATTDANGLAMVTPLLDVAPGDYLLSASFAGDEDFAASSAQAAAFTVAKEDTATTLAVAGQGSKRSLQATTADGDSNEGIAGVVVEFFADGTSIGTDTTDGQGAAQLDIPARYRGGHHDFEARFAGDDYYRSSTGTSAT